MYSWFTSGKLVGTTFHDEELKSKIEKLIEKEEEEECPAEYHNPWWLYLP